MTSAYLKRPLRSIMQASIDLAGRRDLGKPFPVVNVAAKALSDPRNKPKVVPSAKDYKRHSKHRTAGSNV